MSYAITPEQERAILEASKDPLRQDEGMAKWEVHFTDGKHSTYLTNDCRDRKSALIGAIERFGFRVSNVK